MLHPSFEVAEIGGHWGIGVRATAFVPAGTIVWVGDEGDHVLSSVTILSNEERERWHHLGWVDGDGVVRMCGDQAQFINHSCAPNSLGPGWDLTVALRDIPAGEQLTEDYALMNRTYSFSCRCGASWCRGGVHMDRHTAPVWLARWRSALGGVRAQMAEVDQPLWRYLTAPDRDALLAVAAGTAPFPSLASELRFPIVDFDALFLK